MRGRFLLPLLILLAAGCASTHVENAPLQAGEANSDRRSASSRPARTVR